MAGDGSRSELEAMTALHLTQVMCALSVRIRFLVQLGSDIDGEAASDNLAFPSR